MPTTILGRVAIVPKGDWVAGSYKYLDVVRYLGASYMCKVTTTTQIPTTTLDWQVVANDGGVVGAGSSTNITGIIKGNGTTFSAAKSGTDYAAPTAGSYLLKGNGSGGFSDASNDYQVKLVNAIGSGQNIKTINNQAILGTGDITIATAVSSGGATNISGLLKGNGSTLGVANVSVDYAPATSGTSILKGNGSGGFSAATAGTDYVIPSALSNYMLASTTSFATSGFGSFAQTSISNFNSGGSYYYTSISGDRAGYGILVGDNSVGTHVLAGNNPNLISLGWAGQTFTNCYLANSPIVTSDIREKNLIGDSIGLDFINKLHPVTYTWKVGGYTSESTKDNLIPAAGTRHHYGLLAQEVKQAMTDCGITDFGGWLIADVNDSESLQMLRYEEFIAPLIKAIQELSARIIVLEGK
jgi:hypothetical protein